jgi:hypothetical protein
MWQKTKNVRNQESNEKKGFLGLVLKSLTQMGSLSVKNVSEKFSRLDTFKQFWVFWVPCPEHESDYPAFSLIKI